MLHLLFRVFLATAAAIPAAPDTSSSNELWQQESYLVSQRASLSGLELWERQERRWRPLRAEEAPSARARVQVVHLWADWCKPCVQELPALRDLAQRVTKDYGSDVTFVFVSETHINEQMDKFLQANPKVLEGGALYHDSNGRLADNLAQGVPQSALTLPVTLLLDRDQIVRHALVGPVLHRRGELVNAIARLLSAQRPVQRGNGDAPRR